MEQAKNLNTKAMGFPLATSLATAGSFLPKFARPESVDNTFLLDNLVSNSVIPRLRTALGSQFTEKENKLMRDLAGSANLLPDVRAKIYKDAIEMINRKLSENAERAQRMRKGDYFKPETGGGAPASAPRVIDFNSLPK